MLWVVVYDPLLPSTTHAGTPTMAHVHTFKIRWIHLHLEWMLGT